MAKLAETPLMKQYIEMKKKHPDAILLFRVGDFYETFSQDAIDTSKILGITLTRRANGSAQYVELAGFPHHALDTYLPRLVRAGRRVAICEQLEDPKLTKKLVKRGITELVTPGVNTSESALVEKENNFLAGVAFSKTTVGVAFLDISTGEFLCAEGSEQYVAKLISNIAPKEILRMRGTRDRFQKAFDTRAAVFELDDWIYTLQAATERLTRHFSTSGLKGFGLDTMETGVIAAGSLLHYLDITQHTAIGHITGLSRIDDEKYVHLDRFSIRNLELLAPNSAEGKSLADVLDMTLTPPGSRLLRRHILFPLLDPVQINFRLDVVEAFYSDEHLREAVSKTLRPIGDMQRLISRLATGRISPRDLLQLGRAVDAACRLRAILAETSSPALKKIAADMQDCSFVANTIEATLNPDAPAILSKGNVIASGVNSELDGLRHIATHGKDALNAILLREQEATGIPSLKISFNNVFGYYIEVRNTHKEKVPQSWIRKQTLVSAERYITPELKEYEEKILGAEDKISSLEQQIYFQLLETLSENITSMQSLADGAARADLHQSLAKAALEYGYCRPEINDSLKLDIKDGRHPVIERCLAPGEVYVSNDVQLDSDDSQILMITGPNMAGKSALLRQTALIALMAQIGSFVPAKSASIGIVDKIFTRVGASDNISSGESTFMVEMNEASSILNNATSRSLILFDELGRGTSTYDGISIAWAIVEHLHENSSSHPRTLFATHYHELNEMEKSFRRIRNFNVAVEERRGSVIFLRKLQPGGSHHSFGIHVAKLAGMPPSIVRRADAILHQLEAAAKGVETSGKKGKSQMDPAGADISKIAGSREGMQLSFFQLEDPLLADINRKIATLDIDRLTPLEALNTLHELQQLVNGK